MKFDKVTLRCDDGAEAAVFTKYTYSTIASRAAIIDPDSISYEICIEDDYVGGDYKGFFGRIKRAWRAFWDKPVVYTGIFTEDKQKMRQFLLDCLILIDKESIEETKRIYKQMDGNASTNTVEI
jgi:hypothetical protein